MRTADLDFERDGARHFGAVLEDAAADVLADRLSNGMTDQPGRRLQVDAEIASLLDPTGPVGAVAANLIGDAARPVRAVLFDKTQAANWTVAWHQDRTIAVRERHEVAGYGPWSMKDGLQHVMPPIEVLAGMVTLRLHLDPCDADNAPLLIALGSHRLGRVSASEAAKLAKQHEPLACHAAAGDVWAYATPILHTSRPTNSGRRRRVLQVDYAASDLPMPLQWLGIACQ